MERPKAVVDWKPFVDRDKRVRLKDIAKEVGLSLSTTLMAMEDDNAIAPKKVDAMSRNDMSVGESDSADSRRSATETANGTIEFCSEWT